MTCTQDPAAPARRVLACPDLDRETIDGMDAQPQQTTRSIKLDTDQAGAVARAGLHLEPRGLSDGARSVRHRAAHTFGGLSDAAFQLIPLLEAGRSADWPWLQEAEAA